MNKLPVLFQSLALVILLFATRASAVVISTNTSITPADTSYEGTDLIITNCTVTLDGAHAFNSLFVAAGGVLTHTANPSGTATLASTVTNEMLVLTGTNPVTLFYADVSGNVSLADTNQNVFTNGADFIQTATGNNQTQIYRTTNSSIPDGATVVATYNWSVTFSTGLNVYLTNDLNVAAGGSLNVNGAGYGGNLGTGHGNTANGPFPDGSGGGHGGNGGMSSSNALGGVGSDLYYQPTALGGSGGTSYAGNGGSGGGRIQINAGGSVNIDGVLAANGAPGTNSRAGGGAGGSIWITAGNIFSGTGSLTANGGAGEPVRGGGGGGGRIAVQYAANNFTGLLAASGAPGGKNGGGAGTVYLRTNNLTPTLVLDNGGLAGTNSVVSLIATTDVIIRNGAWLTPPSSPNFQPRNLLIGTNGMLAMASVTVMNVVVGGNCIIQPGGILGADLLGSGPGAGTSGSGGGSYPGTSGIYYSGGGGHGGYGGFAGSSATPGTGGVANDYAGGPTFFGGGGGGSSSPTFGGAGGGVLQLNISGTLQVDGKISANGGNGSGTGGGGGAGGSIYIQNCNLLSGSGSITANGGNGVPFFGGGGGGGRIAVYFNANNFTGSFSTFGGTGTNNGGAGTIYLKTNSAANAQLVMDNGGNPGAFTTSGAGGGADLMLRNGANFLVNSSASFGNLVVASNATVYATNATPGQITLTANTINIQPGGLISSDFGGYAAGSGSGAGNSSGATSPYYAASGAGHGGFGGGSIYIDAGTAYAGGGTAYDTQSNPAMPGSGGGSSAPYSTGGRGGGALKFSVAGNFQLDGTISVNAGNGSGLGGGGGSGGSVNIACATLAGAGSINANGGNGASSAAGGGAGGMIYASFNANAFAGNATAFGGTGYRVGAAGTVYFQTNGGQSLLILDNGGRRGTNTPVSSFGLNWIIRNGAVAQPNGSSFTLNSLVIGSNAVLLPYVSNGNVNFTANGNVTVQPGGAIIADNSGSAPNNGTGRGYSLGNSPYYPSGGGGHGGFGGLGLTNQGAGGTTYDSTYSPSQTGSGGGYYNTSYGSGGAGGGFIRMIVNGTLQHDGLISANGGSGTLGGGGGAGGGIYISVNGNGAFKGGGSISANGGNGGPFGGGGGGGRVAIYYYSNFVHHSTFNGPVTAYGGGGANYGGAGTVYLQNYSQSSPQLILDNNNNAGTNTTFDTLFCTMTIQNKAVGVLPTSVWSLDTLTIRTNSALVGPTPGSPGVRVITANNLTIDAGGALSLDGGGYGSGSGTGYAQYNATIRGGAGYGGFGGGGWTYGNGGAGGGALNLTVYNTLTVNGKMSANGGNGDLDAGGGSGGGLNLQNIGSITGSGVISANGGAGTGSPTGGGGGGRIALIAGVNTFTGQISATGGGGTYPGGAGTVYKKISGYQTLTIDNGGLAGASTPLVGTFSPPATPFDLNIANQAVVNASSPLPLLNNFNLGAGGVLTGTAGGIFVSVRTNANLLGSITVDNRGFAQGGGTGRGNSLSSSGAGGGYGGAGGNAAGGALGGGTYGSVAQPTDFGSGGGAGGGSATDGSEGGGAIRLSVGGNLNLSGNVSANGDFGWQDSSGGGAGGSVWLAANSFTGAGNVSAYGGNGDLWNGGGGGGGRIAIYSPTNLFLGTTNVSGGFGFANGQNGTMFVSTSFLNFSATTMSPTDTVNSTVSYVDLTFSDAVDPASVAAGAFTITTPAGVMDPSNFIAAATSATSVRLSFPLQNTLGTYTLTAAAPLASILGLSVQNFSGTFTISIPTISGTVSDTNGVPVAGVTIQPDGGLPATTTDTNGSYSVPVPPNWVGGLTPSLGQLFFFPGTLGITNIITSLTNQNFLMLPSITPTLTTSLSDTNILLGWNGINGVNYQVQYSSDLVNWTYLYPNPISGTNGLMQFVLPMNLNPSPTAFFRLLATH